MSELEKAARQALEALEFGGWDMTTRAITALRRALEQPAQQEPVAWATYLGECAHVLWGKDRPEYPIRYEVPLYTRPQAREPLTDEEIQKLAHVYDNTAPWTLMGFARAIEAAHGIKGDA